jgi:hypothetical protein
MISGAIRRPRSGRICRQGKVIGIFKILIASCLESRIKCYTSIRGLSHLLVLMPFALRSPVPSPSDGMASRCGRLCARWRAADEADARRFVIFFSQIGGCPSIVNEIGVIANINPGDPDRKAGRIGRPEPCVASDTGPGSGTSKPRGRSPCVCAARSPGMRQEVIPVIS